MVNDLEYLSEFQAVLQNYHISEVGKKLLAKTKLVLLAGPSSSGRNTIINALKEGGGYHAIVSDTTRAPRVNNGVPEKDGVEYWFRTEQEILSGLRSGNFLEAAIIHDQQVSGISLRELEKAQQEGKIAVNEIETVGMHNIIRVKPDVFAFFVVPPSFSVWMERMDSRGKMPELEKRRRLSSAVKEFDAALANDYYRYIVNDSFDHSVKYIDDCIAGDCFDEKRQLAGQSVIQNLLTETNMYLNTVK
ncbi:hypothetical protein KC968_03715 [Candidatus Saccharibacteria bacterium]|nr:hypothetical protein [Candidatus Saccharibacteria bacterium]